MKKLLSMVAAVSMAAVMLTGCGVPANTVHSIDDLNGKSIGVQLGTTGDTYADGIEGATVEKFAKGADAVQALKQGKVDAVIIDSEPAEVFVSKNDDIIAHIKHMVNIMGDECVAFGSDFDGIDCSLEMRDYECFKGLIAKLEQEFSSETMEKICYRNVIRVLKECI